MRDQVIDLAVGDMLEITFPGGDDDSLRQGVAGVFLHRGHQRQQCILAQVPGADGHHIGHRQFTMGEPDRR